MSESADWLAEHRGEFVRTLGYVWECGDDDCRCEQALVVDRWRNRKVSGYITTGVWEGTFTTADGRADGEPSPDRELAAYRRALRDSDPEREAAIEWQQGVDYGD